MPAKQLVLSFGLGGYDCQPLVVADLAEGWRQTCTGRLHVACCKRDGRWAHPQPCAPGRTDSSSACADTAALLSARLHIQCFRADKHLTQIRTDPIPKEQERWTTNKSSFNRCARWNSFLRYLQRSCPAACDKG